MPQSPLGVSIQGCGWSASTENARLQHSHGAAYSGVSGAPGQYLARAVGAGRARVKIQSVRRGRSAPYALSWIRLSGAFVGIGVTVMPLMGRQRRVRNEFDALNLDVGHGGEVRESVRRDVQIEFLVLRQTVF